MNGYLPIQGALKILFWNIKGLSTFNSFCLDDLEYILSYQILCLSETWALEKPSIPTILSEHYNMAYSVAIRDKQRGRGSGGLLTLVKKNIQFEQLDVSNLWIFTKIKFSQSETLTLGNVYINPKYSMTHALESLKLLLAELNTQSDQIIIGGDTNARISDENYLDETLADEFGLLAHRVSRDEVKNRRGEELISCMEDCGFVVLNGRTEGDVPGRITFHSGVGISTVDLVWANLESLKLVSELTVSDAVVKSDHQPITLTLNILCIQQQQYSSSSKITRFKWLPEKSSAFKEAVNSIVPSSEPELVYGEVIHTLENVARDTGMVHEFTVPTNCKLNKPWYTGECRELKKRTRQMYRAWTHKPDQHYLNAFLEIKKEYFRVCMDKKRLHEADMKEKLINVKSSQEFWKAVQNFRPKMPNKSKVIPMDEWGRYLQGKYQLEENNIRSELLFIDVLRYSMDSDFCIGELEKGISNMKNGKSPGPDNILNEYLKSLNNDWKLKLLSFVNFIFDGGSIPDELTSSFMFMLHKKGELKCENFRSIALENNILKLITHLVSQRVLAWSENYKLFSETQAGFRPHRGCTDHIFSLQSIISLHLIKRRKLYAAFIDYKSAFSEVQHDLLFVKMFDFGISGKIISLLRRIYGGASTQIRVDDKKTPPNKITKGVLEGDSISPVAFIIFINDMEEYFRRKGAEGVNINHTTDILLLLYCDDVVILSSSRPDMQRKLNILSSYSEQNKMFVSETKSKVVVFRRGGRLARTDTFEYNNKQLEVCNEYVYLGVKMSSHGVFHKAALQAISKGKMAISSVKSILINSKMTSQESRMKLFHSIVRATLLYGAEIWGSRYENEVEVVQTQFLKSVFCLSRCTPNYMVRLEFGVIKVAHQIMKQMLGWWLRMMLMSEERYPRICYNELYRTDQLARNIEKYNWVSQLRIRLVDLGYGGVWVAQSTELLKNKMTEILDKYEVKLLEEDYTRLANSSYCSLYKELKPKPSLAEDMKPNATEFLLKPGPIDRTRIVTQIRLCSNQKVSFYVNRIGYSWNSDEQCSICNLNENEDLYHFLFKCPHYSSFRNHYFKNTLSIKELVENPTRCDINNLYFYVLSALKLRSFLRNE